MKINFKLFLDYVKERENRFTVLMLLLPSIGIFLAFISVLISMSILYLIQLKYEIVASNSLILPLILSAVILLVIIRIYKDLYSFGTQKNVYKIQRNYVYIGAIIGYLILFYIPNNDMESIISLGAAITFLFILNTIEYNKLIRRFLMGDISLEDDFKDDNKVSRDKIYKNHYDMLKICKSYNSDNGKFEILKKDLPEEISMYMKFGIFNKSKYSNWRNYKEEDLVVFYPSKHFIEIYREELLGS